MDHKAKYKSYNYKASSRKYRKKISANLSDLGFRQGLIHDTKSRNYKKKPIN